jgi:acyl-CoA synthetase (NDP forming)
MESLSGEYLGAIKHPTSYNKLQGQNAIPLLQELHDICTCIGKMVDYKEEYNHNLDEDNRKSIKKEVEATEQVVLTDAEADDMIASILIHEMEVDEMVGKWLTEKNDMGQLGEMD